MPFDDYRPRDKQVTGCAHLASWTVLLVLMGMLGLSMPQGQSLGSERQTAASSVGDCITS